jgi:hypothetical protein
MENTEKDPSLEKTGQEVSGDVRKELAAGGIEVELTSPQTEDESKDAEPNPKDNLPPSSRGEVFDTDSKDQK